MTDREIAALADECISRFHDEALMFAAREVAHYMLLEDIERCRVWIRVMATLYEQSGEGRIH